MDEVSEPIGRQSELAALRAFWDGGARELRAVVLEGPAGIGKSTLWQAGVDAARGVVLACRAARAEAQLPYVALGDLLAGVIGTAAAAELPDPQRRALRIALLLEDPGANGANPRAIGLGVTNLLRLLARRAPVAVCVDDAQWLDDATARTLAFALRRVGEAPVRVLLAVRRDQQDAERSPLEAALPESAVTRVRLGPLDRSALHRLLAARLGRALSGPALARVARVSGGNPLYALELARTPDDARLPPTLRELMAARLAPLTSPAREALEVAAALGAPTVEQVVTLTGTSRGVDEALEVEVLVLEGERLRFAHPLLAAAIEAGMGTRRQALHDRLARGASDPLTRAHHLALAATAPDPKSASELEDAAGLAAARGAPLDAAQLLERSLVLDPEGPVDSYARRALLAARLHFAGGDEHRALDLLQTARARLPAGPERADLLEVLALLEFNHLDTGLGILGQALEEAAGDAARRSRILLSLAEGRAAKLEFAAALVAANEALPLARQVGDPGLEASALSHVAAVAGALAELDPVPLYERAQALAQVPPTLDPWWHPRFSLARWHLYADDLERARDGLLAHHRETLSRGEEHARHAGCLHLTELECRAGDYAAARAWALEGYELTEQLGAELSRTLLLYARALVAAHTGAVAEARALAEEGFAAADAIGFGFGPLHHLHVLGFLALSQGDFRTAHTHLAPLLERMAAIGLRDPGMVPCHADAIESAIGAGHLDEAEAWLGAYEEVGARTGRARVAATGGRCRGLLTAARGDLPAALATLSEALTAHEALPVPLERARTLLAQGSVLRRAKHRREARAALEAALAEFERLGAPLWADRARGELGRVGGRAPGATGGLSATETRVAALVAEGHTNREVAAELYLSVRAVEANLSRAYAKLGVRSRTELTRRLAAARES